jgi:hypothetical protein
MSADNKSIFTVLGETKIICMIGREKKEREPVYQNFKNQFSHAML